jgi:hypothetical protein
MSSKYDLQRASTKVCDLREGGIVWHGEFDSGKSGPDRNTIEVLKLAPVKETQTR